VAVSPAQMRQELALCVIADDIVSALHGDPGLIKLC
jgi:hypothetical protein